jgi:indole-3-glycerol phosphate synthase
MSGDLLSAVVAAARRSARAREAQAARDVVESALLLGRTPAGEVFRASLRAGGVRVIAECKRRSPSRGVLRREYDAAAIARSYQAHGAAAVSVLTEPTFFDGSLDHLRQVRAAVDLPLLCKDFIVTEYQIVEAAAAGADAVLLIVAALDDEALRGLLQVAARHGLAVLTEVHDALELARALDAGADVVGVNSRNLRTLQVDVGLLDELGPRVPPGVIAVAESGLRTAADIERLRRARYDAFLIGERFMTEPVPGEALGTLRAAAEGMHTT